MKKNIIILIIIIVSTLAVVFVGVNRLSENGDVQPTKTLNQNKTMEILTLTSSVFEHNGQIPSKYTCDSDNMLPPLSIGGVDGNAQSLVLIMDDPDAVKPAGKVWDHWVVWNVSPTTKEIKEGVEPEGVHGVGSGGNSDYRGPCPPDREHRYFFKLYALDTTLNLPEGSTKSDVEKAMEGHVMQEAELVGLYERTN